METEIAKAEKFLFLQDIENYLLAAGWNQAWTDLVTFLVGFACFAIILFIVGKIGSVFFSGIVKRIAKTTKTLLDDFLIKRKFFDRAFKVALAMLAYLFIKQIFAGFETNVISGAQTVIGIYIAIMLIPTATSLLDALNDNYDTKPDAKYKSIKSYLQAVKIIIYIICGVYILGTILKINPLTIITGLGASAAIISLIFRDTILGLIASLQISSQQIIRPGDWVEIPSKNADGIVEDINLLTVNIRNWNNTVTTVSSYSFVSDSFINWRYMQEGYGRRFKRPILIDVHCIHKMNPLEIKELLSSEEVHKYAGRIIDLMEQGNTSKFVTNIGLYRCYLEAYLIEHPNVVNDRMLTVRYIQPDENGVTLELYGFATERNLIEYERIVADIFENAFIMAPMFGIRLYQRPSDKG